MINKTQKKQIKKVLGGHYVATVQSYLKEKNILNKNGAEHSASMITNVMNGTPHSIIEDAIYELVAIKKQKQNERKELLQKTP